MRTLLGKIRYVLALGVVAGALLAALPTAASAHPGPPSSTWKRCKFLGIYRGAKTFTGRVYARANTATYYLVKITPVFPFGWSGTVTANWNTHPRIWIFPGTKHWFQSSIVFTSYPSGTYSYRIYVSPNYGVFNAYAAALWAPYNCS